MRQLKRININNILFLDIETAPLWEHWEQVPEYVQKEWIYKFKFRAEAPVQPELDEDNPNRVANFNHFEQRYLKYFAGLWKKEAGLYPEFSRIVCISFGTVWGDSFYIKTISDQNEGDLINKFFNVINHLYKTNKALVACAHNGKGFDFPYIIKRAMLHRLELPVILDTYGLKPWEMITLLDTLEIWKMGSQQGAGLPSISMHFGIASPKDDIEGADVSRCYHAGEIERICTYCEKDVVALVNVFKAMRAEELIPEDKVIRAVE